MNDLSKTNREQLHKMSFMKRYNNEVHIHDENVAEHSFYVAIYTMKICDILGFEIMDPIRCASVERALIHDIHEIELSDIPHNIKTGIENLNNLCISFEEKYNNEHFPNLINFESDLNKSIIKIIHSIVDLADILSVIQYSKLEFDFGNRKKFGPILVNAESRINNTINNLLEAYLELHYDVQNIIGLKHMIEE